MSVPKGLIILAKSMGRGYLFINCEKGKWDGRSGGHLVDLIACSINFPKNPQGTLGVGVFVHDALYTYSVFKSTITNAKMTKKRADYALYQAIEAHNRLLPSKKVALNLVKFGMLFSRSHFQTRDKDMEVVKCFQLTQQCTDSLHQDLFFTPMTYKQFEHTFEEVPIRVIRPRDDTELTELRSLKRVEIIG